MYWFLYDNGLRQERVKGIYQEGCIVDWMKDVLAVSVRHYSYYTKNTLLK